MSIWAHPCRPCDGSEVVWYVSETDVRKLDPDVRIVRVKVGKRWRCARLERERRVDVEGLLVRPVVGTDARDCPECEDL